MEDQELSEQLAAIERLMLGVGWLEQRRFARDLAEFGLTVPQFVVLRSILHRDQQSSMSTLADETLQCCATMTGIVDRLVKMGLVTRQRDPLDRRRVFVQLTTSGRAAMDKVRHRRVKRLRETLVHLAPEDAGELLRLLSLYLEAFRQQYEEDTP